MRLLMGARRATLAAGSISNVVSLNACECSRRVAGYKSCPVRDVIVRAEGCETGVIAG